MAWLNSSPSNICNSSLSLLYVVKLIMDFMDRRQFNCTLFDRMVGFKFEIDSVASTIQRDACHHVHRKNLENANVANIQNNQR